jgi:hypothetical protein
MTKFKPEKEYEKKEKRWQKEGNRAYIKHEEKEVAEAKKAMKGKDGKDGKKNGMKKKDGKACK